MTRYSLWCAIVIAIAAVTLPASAGAVAAREPGKAPPAVRLHKLTKHVRVDADGRAVTIAHVEMLATNDAAAMQLGQVPINYDAALATLEITNAYTLKKDGTRIPVDVSAIYDQLAPGAEQMQMYTKYHVKTIIFPQFAAGDTAVYTTTLTQKKALLPGQFWAGETFARTTAYDSVDETIDAPDSLHLRVETHGVEFSRQHADGRTIFHWHYSAPIPKAPEHLAIAPLTKMPRFFVSTFADYAALGAAIAAEAVPKMAVTPAIQALADKITRHVYGRRAKAKALYEWVSRNIRYVAVEFGRGALVPHAASRVLTNGYGDCKDHVALLGAFLNAEGIKNEGVLIDSGQVYDLTEVPTLTGLNHIITYLPRLHLYVDSTAGVAPFGVLPFDEYGKPIVYAAVGHAERGTMPVLPPGGADLYTRTVSTLAKDGTLSGTTTTTGRGAYQLAIRAVGLAAQALGPENTGAKLMARHGYGGDATGTLVAPPPTKPSDSYTVKGTFKAQHWREQATGSRRFNMPGGMRVTSLTGDGLMGHFGNSGLKDDASEPCYSGHAAEDLSLTAPDGMQFDHVPSDLHVKTAYLRFDAHWSLSGETLSVHRDFASHINQTLCTPDIRKVNKDAIKKISDNYDTQLMLEQVDGGNNPPVVTASDSRPAALSLGDPKFAREIREARSAAVVHNDVRAIRILTEILKLPDLPGGAAHAAAYTTAALYVRNHDFEGAIENLNAALKRFPGDRKMLKMRAYSYEHSHRLAKAKADFTAVLKAVPSDTGARYSRGNVEFRSGEYHEALADYRALPDGNGDVDLLRAVTEEKLGHHKQATADVRKAADAGYRDAMAQFQAALKPAAKPAYAPPGAQPTNTGTGTGITHSRPSNRHSFPPYPALARMMNYEGRAVVIFTVNTDGGVSDVSVLQPTGFYALDDVGMNTVRRWRYQPAMRNGRPIAVRKIVRFNFTLDN